MDLAQMLRAQWPITIEASEKSLGYLSPKRGLAALAVILIALAG